jgi:hypothetical protein
MDTILAWLTLTHSPIHMDFQFYVTKILAYNSYELRVRLTLQFRRQNV